MSAKLLFARLENDLNVRVDGLIDTFPSCELFWQDQGNVFLRGQQSGGGAGQLSV